MAAKHVAVLLAEGFEEIEAVTVIDVLRRAGIEVAIAATASRAIAVTGAHGIQVMADTQIGAVDAGGCDLVVLPGGMPGSENLAGNPDVLKLVRQVWQRGGMVAAICAAPIALHAAGLLDGRRATVYPSFVPRLTGVQCLDAPVVVDQRVITSRGPGTAFAFALELLRQLGAADQAETLAEGMLLPPGAQ